MANIKELFGRTESPKVLKKASLETISLPVESVEYVKTKLEEKNRFVPFIDFGDPKKFCFYGSAQSYYEDALNHIQGSYPYDGSLKEKLLWNLSASYLDLWLFENKYPRTNGYVNLGLNYGTHTTTDSGYSQFSNTQLITFRGGPHTASSGMIGQPLYQTFDKSNVYDTGSRRANNLEINGNNGITLEFWLKRGGWVSGSESPNQVVFDLWNSASVATPSYGRFRVEIRPQTSPESRYFHVDLASGTSGWTTIRGLGSGSFITGSTWEHHALVFWNSGSSLVGEHYRNGVINDTLITGSTIGLITGSMLGSIGALITGASGTLSGYGWAKLSGSIDELRFWKCRRTPEEIGKYWFTQVGGGTNTDEANTNLGLYYKFNEGIVGSSSIDSKILDYSGRITNGSWVGYTSSARSTASAIVESSAALSEFKDPILYQDHSSFISLSGELNASGSSHDDVNTSYMYGTIPSWITEEDREKENNTLKKFIQVLASYFDNVQLQIQALPTLRHPTYIQSGSHKPYPFVSRILSSYGLVVPEVFTDATILESLASRDEFIEYQEKFENIRNKLYQNIYNNLVYIFKTKGTEKAFRNVLRCYGIGEELVKINLYANNGTYTFDDNYYPSSLRKKFVDFNDVDRFVGTVYQTSSLDTNTRSFVSSSQNVLYQGQTFETEVVFPKKFDVDSSLYFVTPFVSASVFGVHTADDAGAFTWLQPDNSNFQVQAIRPQRESKDVYFLLTGSSGFVLPLLSSSIFTNVYNNNKWNLSVRLKPTDLPYAGFVSGSVPSYVVEFSGYNNISDVIVNSFSISGTIPFASASLFLTGSKRFYVGSHRTNFTGSVIDQTDVKVSSLKVWMKYLNNNELISHTTNPASFGVEHPSKNAFITTLSQSFGTNIIDIPNIETLALNWSFDNVTSSGPSSDGLPTTSDAKFLVNDLSSGSLALTSRHAWLGPIANRIHLGQGDFFLPNDTNVVNTEYLYAFKQGNPEALNSFDLVEIRSQDDLGFTRDFRPIKYFFSIEKGMYSIISDEMMKMFSTLKDLNTIIGEPANRYRQNYKNLDYLRHYFFEKIQNVPDLEKFTDYFKWIDNAVSHTIKQLIPASAEFSPNIRNLVESHILERNKYWTKMPTLESKVVDPIGGTNAINELLYSWKTGSAPINGSESENPYWWKNRAERNVRISSGDVNVDNNRTLFLSATLSTLNRSFTTPVRIGINEEITGSATIKPLRIRNVKNSSATSSVNDEEYIQNPVENFVPLNGRYLPLGNFSNEYEVLQTTGRRINPRDFIKAQGLDRPAVFSTIISGTTDFTLPVYTDTKNKTIFVNRFSAPGDKKTLSRGYLDPIAEEYSSYNGMNSRNFIVRDFLNGQYLVHADQGGLFSIDNTSASFHKVQRNTGYRVELSGTQEVITPSYDNGFIVRQIPRRDVQYAWITASIIKEVQQPFDFYNSDFSVPQGLDSTTSSVVQFVSASVQTPRLSFSGLALIISESIDTGSNLLLTGATRSDLNSILLNRNGPYHYPTWKQLRISETKVARFLRGNNIISIIDPPKEYVFNTRNGDRIVYKDKRADTFTNYKEGSVYFGFKPVKHTFIMPDSPDPIELEYSYESNLVLFANQEINNKLGIKKCNEPVYEKLIKLYTTGGQNKTIKEFIQFSFGSGVYPKKQNVGLNTSRSRTNYTEVDGTGSNGFDRGPVERRTFWKTTDSERQRPNVLPTIPLNSAGQQSARAISYWPMDRMFPAPSASSGINPFGVSQDSRGHLTPSGQQLSGTTGELNSIWGAEVVRYIGIDLLQNSEFGFDTPFFDSLWVIPYTSYHQVTSSQSYIFYSSLIGPNGTTANAWDGEYPPGWYTDIYSSKKPWYDTYQDYALDVKPLTKEYNVLPEFNISEHLKFYVEQNGGNFRTRNDKILSVYGGHVSSSALTYTGGFDETFTKTFTNSDVVANFDKFLEDHKDNNEIANVRLTCDAIKKLLPYQGFYPIARCHQLGTLLSESLGKFIGGGLSSISSSFEVWKNGKHLSSTAVNAVYTGSAIVQALFQPFFAPGLVYNTIKSGIAVDWPIFTSSTRIGELAGDNNNYYSIPPDYRLPFETLVDLNRYLPVSSSLSGGSVFYLPDIYSYYEAQNVFGRAPSLPYFYWTGRKSPLFELGMHNFLAESVKFFLKDEKLSSFTSKPSLTFAGKMKKNNSYYMDVELYKTNDFAMFESYWTVDGPNKRNGTLQVLDPNSPSPTGSWSFTGRWFGPGISWMTASSNLLFSADPGQAPYVPPYLYGKTTARIKYTPDGTETGENVLSKILGSSSVEFVHQEMDDMFQRRTYGQASDVSGVILPGENPNYTGTFAYQHASRITSSISLFGRTTIKQVEYDITSIKDNKSFVAKTAIDPINQSSDVWVISSKYETPCLNFKSQLQVPPVSSSNVLVVPHGRMPRGMWSGYGDIPSGSEGIYMAIRESFKPSERRQNTGSLIDICGFEVSNKRVGELAEKREMFEAVIAIPFVDEPITNKEFATTTQVLGKNFFTIPRKMYDLQKNQKIAGKPAIEPGKDFGNVSINDTSISQLSEKLQKYVLPPELNFDVYSDIQPFVMYVFEFNGMFDKQDLADIWQGVMPKPATTATKDQVVIEHPNKPWEFFGGKKLPSNVRWMVFKVKQKAEINYYKITADNQDDDRFRFDFKVGNKTPEYSYNYPYDFCSLVEFAKIAVEYDIEPKK